MTSDHQRAMRDGRKRWERERRRDAIRRVDAYKRWLRQGSQTSRIPEIPSDADYAMWRYAREGRR